MNRWKTVEVSEAELEDVVRQAPELLEVGLRYVDHQRRARDGRIDVLLVDSGQALVVAELKIVEDDGMLWQALDYYDYVQANLDGLAHTYRDSNIDHQQAPRLFLIAPSFSVTLLSRIKWLSISSLISLFSYRCIMLEGLGGEPIPVYSEIKPPVVREPVTASSLQDHLMYVTDEAVRSKLQDVLSTIQAFGSSVSIDPVKSGISIKVNGRVFAYAYAKRRFFTFGYYADPDGQWVNENIQADTDTDQLKAHLRAAFTSQGPRG